MYSVTLANKDCIFDEATGFETLEEAMEWAAGRGYTYHVMISDDDDDETVSNPLIKDYWVK